VLVPYTLTEEDVRGPFSKTLLTSWKGEPTGPRISIVDRRARGKVHVSPKLLSRLNPGKIFPGPAKRFRRRTFARICHRGPPRWWFQIKAHRGGARCSGNVLAEYPATIGSQHDPLPIGGWKVTHVNKNPVSIQPDLFWNAPDSDVKAKIHRGRTPCRRSLDRIIEGALWHSRDA